MAYRKNITQFARILGVLALLIALVVSYQRDIQTERSNAYEQGISEMMMSTADCSLADARADKCFIPCSTDTDCMEKNGMTDH